MSSPDRPRRIAVACQGGGSHTAFTAGVLARLLRSPALDDTEIVGLSGTSGGAICALVAWDRLRGGQGPGERASAARALEEFWADNAARSPLARLQNAGVVWAGALQGIGLLPASTPYLVPRPLDGTRQFLDLLGRHVDLAAITPDPDGREPLLLLGAVDVLTGEFRAFSSRTDRITDRSVLASAAIPTLFRAVHTHGGVYWDGLFSQNPPVRDLLDTDPDELWVVQINPSAIGSEPRTPIEIADRRNALAGNLSLNQELGFVETIDRLLAEGSLTPEAGYRHVTVRVLEMPPSVLASRVIGSASKLNRDASFLAGLQASGATAADRFLGALAVERAVLEGDVSAFRAAVVPEAVLYSTAPFRERDPGGVPLREHADRLLDGEFTVDPARKQVTRDAAVWDVRVTRAGDPAGAVPGRVEAELDDDGRITTLRLGPGD
ncbi:MULTISPECIES: patatin-like phospholipase family protein [unclassified Pseudonocardia]|uniref:patatin-like phospholipase family protein n=1 Tax=unclassified Pseudonocardia TaxID=2619320 RepID=UPI000A72B048|nr:MULTISPECIES: patatin-like phospholipase family protein [unclassified Pseudonocardia]